MSESNEACADTKIQDQPKQKEIVEGIETACTETSTSRQSTLSSLPQKIVLVWDLDETLIIFNTLLNGAWFGPDESKEVKEAGITIAEAWADIMFDILDNIFNFPAVEHSDPSHIDDVLVVCNSPEVSMESQPADTLVSEPSKESKVKLSFTAGQRAVFLKLLAAYDAGIVSLPLTSSQREDMEKTWTILEDQTGNWATKAEELLSSLSSSSILIKNDQDDDKEAAVVPHNCQLQVIHCLVTRGQLFASLVKMVLFKLSKHFKAENIYSASEATKLDCFKRIAERYGPDSHFVAIGDGQEEQISAQKIGWKFVKIVTHSTEDNRGETSATQGLPSDQDPSSATQSLPPDPNPSSDCITLRPGVGDSHSSFSNGSFTIHELNAAGMLSLILE